jgi:ribose 5-phosphate isomerase B
MNYQQEEIEAIVRQVVTRTLGNRQPVERHWPPPQRRPILDADKVNQLPARTTYHVEPGTIVTPLARQAAMERGIQLLVNSNPYSAGSKSITDTQLSIKENGTIAIGADHGGFALKEQLKTMLESAEFGYTVVDCGTYSADSVDYPDYAYSVAQLVANGRAWRGIMIDGAGIGSCMAANKVPGVRAAMCYDQATAVNSREHNNANVLTLGAGLIGPSLAKQIVTTWLNTEFGGGRHGRRVDKIDAIGKRFSKSSN